MTDVVTIRPPLVRYVTECLVALAVAVGLCWLINPDAISGVTLIVIASMTIPLGYRSQSIVVTSDGLSFRSAGWSRREIAWPAVQSITLGRGPFRSIVLNTAPGFRFAGYPERYRLNFGRGSVLLRPAQEVVRTQIEEWWMTYRGADWPLAAPPEPLRFPPGVNPFEPPAHG